jgi:proteasome accessory factor A
LSDSVIDLVTHDKAGERIVERLSIAAERRMRADGFLGQISAFKNNTDTPGNTWGCHENYLTDRERVSFRQLASQLIPFFVTRQIFTGSGKVKSTHRGGYAISQRARHIREEVSIGTTTARGIINTRDEPHADREKYRRLHVIVGDSNMSEFTTFLKIGTTSIILRMIEDHFIRKRLTLSDSVRALQQISEDTSCTRKIELENGKRLSAIELQKEYLDCAKLYFEREESDPITDQIIERWEYVLNCLEEDPMLLSREVDWIIKKKLIENYVMKRGLKWDSAKVLMLDLQYHNIRSDLGLYYKLERVGLVERISTNADIEQAMIHPPETTRAKFRGRFVKLIQGGKITCGVNWSYIQLYEPYQKLYVSTDPLKVEYDEASRAIYHTTP